MDLLLANALFGLILVTSALAIAHTLCNLLFLARPALSKATRFRTRILVTFAFGVASMWLFTKKGTHGHYDGIMGDDLGVHEVLARQQRETVERDLLSPASVTTLAEANLPQNAGPMSGHRFAMNVGPDASTVCQAWSRTLSENGGSVATLGAKTPEDGLVLCVDNPLAPQLVDRLSKGDLSQKPVLFVGPVHRKNARFLGELLGAEGWMEGQPGEQYLVGIGRSLAHRWPAGLQLNFGAYERAVEHHYFAKTPSPEAPLLASGLTLFRSNRYSALMTGGRRAWTSLPARLYGSNEILYAQHWTQLWSNVIRQLYDEPRLQVKPQGMTDSIASVTISIDRKELPLLELIRFAKGIGVALNFYVNPSFIEDYEAVLREAIVNGHAVGVLMNRQIAASNLQNVTGGAAARIQSLAQSGEYPVGALVTGEGFSAAAVGTLQANGFHYVLSDGYADRLTPYPLDGFSGEDVLAERSAYRANAMYMVPFFGGVHQRVEVERLKNEMRLAFELGGPYLAAMNLGEDNLSRIQGILKELSGKNVSFKSVIDVFQVQVATDALSVHIDRDQGGWSMTVDNAQESDSRPLVLELGEGWGISSDKGEMVGATAGKTFYKLTPLAPKEKRRIRIDRNTGKG